MSGYESDFETLKQAAKNSPRISAALEKDGFLFVHKIALEVIQKQGPSLRFCRVAEFQDSPGRANSIIRLLLILQLGHYHCKVPSIVRLSTYFDCKTLTEQDPWKRSDIPICCRGSFASG